MTARSTTIDLNCDLGEGFPHDADLIPLVSSINIACGGHAGDDATMRTAVRLAKDNGVTIGAHPGYDDRDNFGRIEVPLPPPRIGELVDRQVQRLRAIAASESAKLTHVKPHGALYHALGRDRRAAETFVAAVQSIDPTLALVGPPANWFELAAKAGGLRFIAEGFVDRRYQPDGTLAARSEPNSLIDDAEQAIAQALSLIREGRAKATDGTTVKVTVQTLCVHGDGPHAVDFLTRLNDALVRAGIARRSPEAPA